MPINFFTLRATSLRYWLLLCLALACANSAHGEDRRAASKTDLLLGVRVVVCESPGEPTTVQSEDLYRARIRDLTFGDETQTVEQELDAIAQRIALWEPVYAQYLLNKSLSILAKINGGVGVKSGVDMPLVKVSYITALADGCEIEQLTLPNMLTIGHGPSFFIKAELWDQLKPVDRAAVVTHLAMQLYGSPNAGSLIYAMMDQPTTFTSLEDYLSGLVFGYTYTLGTATNPIVTSIGDNELDPTKRWIQKARVKPSADEDYVYSILIKVNIGGQIYETSHQQDCLGRPNGSIGQDLRMEFYSSGAAKSIWAKVAEREGYRKVEFQTQLQHFRVSSFARVTFDEQGNKTSTGPACDALFQTL